MRHYTSFCAVVAVIAASGLFVGVANAQNGCASLTSCAACVANNLCGWCSEPVVYPGNVTGPQCAGFTPGHPNPFACNGIYSTGTCTSGYLCNETDFTCYLAPPGQGVPQLECESQCYNKGQIYLCNTTSKQCYVVPPGTHGAGSLAKCEASCSHPSPHPVPPPPTTAPSSLYQCNYTSGQCVTAPAGKGESKSACEQACQKSEGDYLCNKFLNKCIKVPPGIPGAKSLAQCELECAPPKPKPGPPPSLVGGTFRGIQIQNDYVTGEFTLQVNQSLVTYVFISNGNTVSAQWTGTPSYFPGSTTNEMWITLTSGPNSGQVIKTITDETGTPGPETSFITMAMSQAGASAPSSIDAAMTSGTEQVYAFARCLTPECIFTLPNLGGAARHHRRHGQQPAHFTAQDAKSSKKKTTTAHHEVLVAPIHYGTSPLRGVDHCSQFGDNCPDCIAHQYCGWCSVNVTYQDGSHGTQCAGFNPNSTTPFVCAGRYSTMQCSVGWVCDQENYQCVASAPGNGMKTKAECEQLCHPTPPPTPPPKLYQCNLTTHQCFLCPNQKACPGGLPLGPCEDGCKHSKHGPHGDLIGTYRGIYIQNAYPHDEVEMVLNKTMMVLYINNVYHFTCNVTSLGADVMLMDIVDGAHQGFKFGTIYQVSSGQSSGLYEVMTMGKGQLGGTFPQDYATPMETLGMQEMVLAKCTDSTCKFNKP